MYGTDTQLIAQMILTNLNVPADLIIQINHWAQIRHLIPKMFNRKQTTVLNALRTTFHGTYHETQRITLLNTS